LEQTTLEILQYHENTLTHIGETGPSGQDSSGTVILENSFFAGETTLDGFINQWESEQSFEDTRIQLIQTTSVNGQSVVYSGSWLKDVSNNVYYNDGNVGVGTSSPDTALDVSGDLVVRGNVGMGFISQWDMELPIISGSGQNLVFSGSWAKDVSNNNVFYDDGNVGIGTSMPNYMLDVSGELISTRYFLKHESGSTTLSSISVNETVDNFTVEKDTTDTKYIVKNSSGSNDLDVNELMATLILEIRDLKARVSALENV
jgi:hypothetical protein